VPLNHVALTVSDRDASAAFYEHLLILASPDGSLVALGEGPVPDGLPRTNHFGFQLKHADEVRGARERLREAGVTETEWQDDHGFVRVQVADPDGYLVELFAIAEMPALPRLPRSRWPSFVVDPEEEKRRVLHEQSNPAHRLRVEHNRGTLLVHLSDEGMDRPRCRSRHPALGRRPSTAPARRGRRSVRTALPRQSMSHAALLPRPLPFNTGNDAARGSVTVMQLDFYMLYRTQSGSIRGWLVASSVKCPVRRESSSTEAVPTSGAHAA
jgi:catechol 2,3-dioxygenase-like lactoylglutathione lyase family enzyme